MINIRHFTPSDRLQEEYRKLYTDNWNRQIEKLGVEKDTKSFWTSIKKLQGTGVKVKATYQRSS